MIENILGLSTAHLTPQTCNEWLGNCSYSAYPKGEFGWLIFVPEEILDGTPADLVSCIELAAQLRCDWLMFDCNYPVLPMLPTYPLR
jgi:hypothetical protein